ncbi:hypothetical protein, partial [Lishizhenia sp.]|uniref:hypothetical protein n=1 Tax=Lishizhenia sp. TaxID=2497594 RepID=UPI00299DF860
MSKLKESRDKLNNLLNLCITYRSELTASAQFYDTVEDRDGRSYKIQETRFKTNIEKSLSFDLTTSYKTLANKFYKVYEAFDSTIFEDFRRNYVPYDSLNYLLIDVKSTVSKLDDIIEFVELHEDLDSSEIEKTIPKYVGQIINKLKKLLTKAVSGCEWRLERIQMEYDALPEKNIGKYLLLSVVWASAKMRGGKTNWL